MKDPGDIMQIDFHHGVTYVVARYAGFGHREAETIANCSQYVDDATNGGVIHFENGAMYSRISSAHRMLDYRNFEALANHFVWIPFHFLPGNGGRRAGENPAGSFIEKIICQPDSPVARDMVRACICNGKSLHGLHRLGITLHVYADTWAHQGFAGVNHEVNNVSTLDEDGQPDKGFVHKLKAFFGEAFDGATSSFVGNAFPLGHGPALSYPDRPYLQWSYRDSHGRIVKRDNTEIFTQAAAAMFRVMQQFRSENPDLNAADMRDSDLDKVRRLLRTITDESGKERHKQWLKAIREGYFSFPPVKLEYRAKGMKSWKHQALGTRRHKDKKSDVFMYSPSFLRSDWKLFHDALMAHRFTVIREILTQYEICAA